MSEPKKPVDQGAIRDKTETHTKNDKEQRKAAAQLAKAKDGGPVSMSVRVYSPFHTYYEGDAFSISAENATGPFDILPHHHSFISLLTPCELTVRTVENQEQKVRISGGLMHVKADQVIVFLDV